MAETMDTTDRTKEEALINEGFRNRINDENADLYKIFSILYGLIIFISGVAFSISHAIVSGEEAEDIKHLAEIYFTFLYWVSIFWMIFCIIDIIHHRHKVKTPTNTLNRLVSNHMNMIDGVHVTQNKRISTSLGANKRSSSTPHINLQLFDDHEEAQLDANENTFSFPDHPDKSNSLDDLSCRSSTTKSLNDTTRDVLIRRRALDPVEEHDLRTYVRHRKNSIVQHAIGYNYDDNSMVGGLYTRVGIGIFCLGTVIHSGLSILSNFENRSCTRWTAVMDDFSRLIFSFMQFFFIFKHSNLIIRAHESAARLAVIHIVVTNLCVWFRMVVIETKLQILEMNRHEMAVAQHSKTPSSFNNVSEEVLNHQLIFAAECSNTLLNGLPVTTFIRESYMKLKPLLYPCTIEFSLMCLTLFFLIWENIGKTFTYNISDKSSTKNVFMVNCHASNKGLFGGMIFFSCTIVSIILYSVFRHKIGDTIDLIPSMEHHDRHTIATNTIIISNLVSSTMPTAHGSLESLSTAPKKIDYSIIFLEVLNLCLLAVSLCATVWSLIKIRKLNYRRTTTRFDDVLIIISLTGIYLYLIFSAFAIISTMGSSTWVAHVKVAIILLEFVEGTVHALFILIALRKRVRRIDKRKYPAREMITLLIILDLSLWFEKTTTTTKHEANPFQLAFYHVIPWSIIAAIATPLQIFFRFHASVCLSHVWAHMYHQPVYRRASFS